MRAAVAASALAAAALWVRGRRNDKSGKAPGKDDPSGQGADDADGANAESTRETEQERREREFMEAQMQAVMAREAWAEQRREHMQRKKKTVPVTLVVGPLGSGKTTLTRRVVDAVRDFTLGVIVNDFAQLNVDSRVIEEDVAALREEQRLRDPAAGAAAVPQVVELSNGCVCCSLQNGLAKAVEAMLSESSTAVDYILVETSGLTDPIEMVRVIEHELGQRVRLDSVAYVLDVDNWERVLADPASQRQLRFADLVVLNKVDLLERTEEDAEKGGEPAVLRDEIFPALGALTSARVLPASFGDVPLEAVMDVVKIEPEREAFGRMILNRAERAMLGGYSIPEEGGALTRRDAVQRTYKSAHKDGEAGLEAAWKSTVFTSTEPFDLSRLQQLVFSADGWKDRLARVKGFVHVAQAPGTRFCLELSGNGRIDLAAQGAWVARAETSIALVVSATSDDTVRELDAALRAACEPAPAAQAAAEAEALAAVLAENDNLEVSAAAAESPLAGGVLVRLTGARSYGFAEDELRLRFGIYLEQVTQTFVKAVNSSGRGVLALPVRVPAGGEGEEEEEAPLFALLGGSTSPELAREALKAAEQVAFRCEFAQVRLCGCD